MKKLFAISIFIVLLIVISIDFSAKSSSGKNILDIALIGDMPYNAKQKKEFITLIDSLNKKKLDYVFHLGDLWHDGRAWNESNEGLPPCSNETMNDRFKLLMRFKFPVILTPGDNDWTDCYRAIPNNYKPKERLTQFRNIFFKGNTSLGQRKIELIRQSKSEKYSNFHENVRWQNSNIMFIAIHIVGSNNNLGRTEEMDKEFKERNEANLNWLQESFDEAHTVNSKAIIILTHANPRFETNWTKTLQKRYLLDGLKLTSPVNKESNGFDDLLESLEEKVIDFKKPVLFIHGDTHTFRIDKPLMGTFSRKVIENFTRVETFGYPNTHWVKLSINPNDSELFSLSPVIVEKNKVDH